MAGFMRWKGQGPDTIESNSVMAFLQARMGSSRLPGKVLMRIQGQTVLERAIRRLQASSAVGKVAVLTTRLSEDDGIVEESYRIGALVYRGPELDVLARFYEAAEEFRPEIIIRATADNPLIDIGSVERIVRKLRDNRLDLCFEAELPYGAATEAITAATLTEVHKRANELSHREHVTLFIKDKPEGFCLGAPYAPEPLRYPLLRLTIDTLEDFTFMDRLIRSIREGPYPFPLINYIPFALAILKKEKIR